MPTKLMLENAKKRKFAFRRENAFFATISLFLDSPFFFTCGNHSYDEYAISKNMLLENMKKN